MPAHRDRVISEMKFPGIQSATKAGTSVLYMLAAPSTPDEAVKEIAARIEAGEKPSVAEGGGVFHHGHETMTSVYRLTLFAIELIRRTIPALQEMPRPDYELLVRDAEIEIERAIHEEFLQRADDAFLEGQQSREA